MRKYQADLQDGDLDKVADGTGTVTFGILISMAVVGGVYAGTAIREAVQRKE